MDSPSRTVPSLQPSQWTPPKDYPDSLTSTASRSITWIWVLALSLLLTTSSVIPFPNAAYAQTDVRQPEPIPDDVRSDLGDAPDSSNHYGMDNTAYPGVLGQFPTVWEDSSGVSGPKHEDVSLIWLGEGKSREFEADVMPDGDGITNILNSGNNDVANQDRFDDGWLNPNVPFVNCEETTIKVRISWNGPVTDFDLFYVNAWFDGNRDGDWDDVGECPQREGRSFEWILQDVALNNPTFVAGTNYIDIDLPTVLVLNEKGAEPAWVRLMLSERPVRDFSPDPADGRGPPFERLFRLGETEDYLTRSNQEPTEIVIRKTADKQVAQPGDTITYRIDVINAGNVDAVGYTVDDPIPAGTTYVGGSVSATAPTESYDGGSNTIKWTGDIPAGTTVTIEFQVTVTGEAPCGGILRNIAKLTAPNGDAQRAINEIKVECPDLQPPRIVKSASPASVAPGGVIDYVIEVINPNNVAIGATVIDNIPAGTAYVPLSAMADAPTVVYDAGGNLIKWGGIVPANGTVTIKFSVQVARDAECDSIVRNVATLITADGVQISSEVVVTKIECPQEPKLDIVKRAVQTIIGPGGIIDYVIVIYNGGNAPANAVMNDAIPAGTTYVPGSAMSDLPTVSYNGGTNSIQWQGIIPAGGSVTIKFSVKVADDIECGSVIVNRAVAYLRDVNVDPTTRPDTGVEPANSVSSSAETKVECPDVELEIRKKADVGSVMPGGIIEYTIEIINGTNSPAAGFTMVDPIPAGTTYISGTANSSVPLVAYDLPNNWVRWAGVVPASGSVIITFKVQVDQEVDCSALIENVAQLLDGATGAHIGRARAVVKIECDEPQSYMDLGDAPDSTNHHGLDNTAYPGIGVLGRFDTVWRNQLPSGPAHHETKIYWLGDFNTAEADADILPDADGVTNILNNGAADVANRDRGDDGWLNPDVALPNCQTTKLKVRISGSGAAPNLTNLFLNIWLDGNVDGDWQDQGECPQQDGRSYEWIVQNYAVDVTTIAATGGQIDIEVPTTLIYHPNMDLSAEVGNWLRFTLSAQEAIQPGDTPLPDGRGPNYPTRFRVGETEDFHVRPDISGEPKLEITKKADVSRVAPGGEITYVINVQNTGTAAATGVTIIDPIPGGTSFVMGSESATAPTVSYNNTLQQVEWTGNIPAGGSVNIEFKVKVHDDIDCDALIKNVAYIVRADGSRIASDGILVRVECPDPDPVRFSDFGDAPDSKFNHHGLPNTAYPSTGVLGNFPTVYDGTPATEAAGPAHTYANVYWLGDRVTSETDADIPVDSDGVTNILDNGAADVADMDKADDGWLNPNTPLNNCERTTLKVRLSGAVVVPTDIDRLFLNVWEDGNADGDWEDTGDCPNSNARAFEWIVQDYAINPAIIPAGGSIDIAVPTRLIYRERVEGGNWIRFTLSEKPAVRLASTALADGRGPNQPDTFQYGETEDIFRPRDITNGEPGQIVLDKAVVTASSPVNIGDVVTYQIYVGHNGGTAPATTTMIDQLPEWVTLVSLPTVTEVNPSGSPLSATYNPAAGPSGTVSWSGTLTPNSMLLIEFKVEVIDCPTHEPDARPIINNVAFAEQTDGTRIRAEADFPVNCQPSTEPEIKLEKYLLSEDGNEVAVSDFLPSESPVFYLRLSSADGMTRTVQISDTLPTGLIAVATSENFGVTSISGGGTVVEWTGIIGPANQPALIKIQVRPTDQIECDKRLINVAQWRTRGFRGESNPATLVLACRDLGDAPDSTNHFGLVMSAYPGIDANYPTVFNVAAPERGPMHLIPQPFHLGRGVSSEREADIGFDTDGINNIVPRANRPNLDRRDDGIDYQNLGLRHCEANRLEVRVSISPAAVAYFTANNQKGYLNVWLDDNRDGDWADVGTCIFQGDIARTTLEHIVIDYGIDVVALGPGLHPIVVPTFGPVNFPTTGDLAQMPSWMRLTLSDRPANKTLSAVTENGDVEYGDGRGHDDAFRFGETEDYLVPAPGVEPEPDPTVSKRGAIRLDRDPATGTLRWVVTWLVRYTNLGTAPATNAVVVDQFDNQQTLINERSVPSTTPSISGNTLTYNVGSIPPAGSIVIRTSADISLAPGTILRNEVSISADADSDMGNNTAVATATVPILPPVIVTPVDGTTCDEEVTIAGKAQPGVDVDVYVDGAVVATVTANADGDWSTMVTMAPGNHNIYAVARSGGLTSGQSNNVLLIVDPSAQWDYQSLRFTRSDGTVIRPSGRLDATGWTIFLRPGETYTVSLRICCEDENAEVTLEIGDQIIILSDDDGDDIYEATFTVDETGRFVGAIRICVLCDGFLICTDGTVLIDPEGTVYDGSTGAIVEGAQVTCLEEQQNAQGGSVFQMWDAAAFGQVNPQTVGADGYYSFFTPAGTFRVSVEKDGYQPYRSPNLVVVDAPVEHDVYLTPAIDKPADKVVRIDDDGFEDSVINLEPGQVVEWVNVGEEGHTIASSSDAGVTAQSGTQGWNSGLLTSGSSYKRQFSSEGTFTISDPSDPSFSATVIVAPNSTQPDPTPEEGTTLFLPMAMR